MAKVSSLRSIFIILLAAFLTHGQISNLCDQEDATLHPDPKNCNGFYTCFLRMAFYYHCPQGLFFNTKYGVCDWPVNVDCPKKSASLEPTAETTDETSPTPTYSTTLETTSTVSTSMLNEAASSTSPLPLDTTVSAKAVQTPIPPSTTFCYSKADDLYPDPERCVSFYQCSRGFSYHFTCQEELLYNPKFKYCDWRRNVNCSESRESQYRNEPITEQINNEPTYSLAPTHLNSTSAAACGNVVCYVPNWSVYRQGVGATFGSENVNPYLCTHIMYAFAHLEGNRLVAFDALDEARGSDIGNFARITNLKLRNPRLKVILAVGGWNTGTSLFSRMAATEDSRAEFINNTIRFVRSRNFDGIDLDWEYPSTGDNPAVDMERYTRLCEELRAAFDKEESGDKRLLLTGAVAAGKHTIDTSYNVPRLSAALDMIHLMTYDLHGIWDGKTGHHSPLKAGSWETNEERYLNIEWAANYWVSLGASKHKLAIGIPLYARTFTLQSTSRVEVGAPVSGLGLPGKYTQQTGSLSYYEVCSIRNQSTIYDIRDQQVPYLVSGDQWVGYDNPASIRQKVQFILENGFGGIMVWDLSMDDFSGRFCGEGSYPLVNAIVSQCALAKNN